MIWARNRQKSIWKSTKRSISHREHILSNVMDHRYPFVVQMHLQVQELLRDASMEIHPGNAKGENFSYRWLNIKLLTEVVNKYLKENWDRIRSDLAQEGKHSKPLVDAGEAVGEGFFNKNFGQPGSARVPVYHVTSIFSISIELIPGNPPSFVIITTFPFGKGFVGN